MSKQQVIDYYASFAEREWDRLTWPEGQLEAAITQDAFARHLPKNARILDLGGGAGRWTVWLAQRGHILTLADLSRQLLNIAEYKIQEYGVTANVEEVIETDACDLSRWANECFDVVLCLGPFYHLPEPEMRTAAACEICRVLKPQGLVFAAFMPIYGFLRRVLALQDERHLLSDRRFVDRLTSDGVFSNTVEGRFNSGYGIRPDQVTPFMHEHGFEQVELLANSGFAASNAQQMVELATENPEAYERVLKIVVDSARDPSNLGSSPHMLYIGRKT